MSAAESGKTIRCVGCKYDLQGLKDVSKCPECGESVAISKIFAECPWMVKKERAIIRKENIYRRNRQAAGGLAILSLLGLISYFVTISQIGRLPDGETEVMFAITTTTAMGGILFWTVTAYAMHARYQHARSARLYRGSIERSDGMN